MDATGLKRDGERTAERREFDPCSVGVLEQVDNEELGIWPPGESNPPEFEAAATHLDRTRPRRVVHEWDGFDRGRSEPESIPDAGPGSQKGSASEERTQQLVLTRRNLPERARFGSVVQPFPERTELPTPD